MFQQWGPIVTPADQVSYPIRFWLRPLRLRCFSITLPDGLCFCVGLTHSLRRRPSHCIESAAVSLLSLCEASYTAVRRLIERKVCRTYHSDRRKGQTSSLMDDHPSIITVSYINVASAHLQEADQTSRPMQHRWVFDCFVSETRRKGLKTCFYLCVFSRLPFPENIIVLSVSHLPKTSSQLCMWIQTDNGLGLERRLGLHSKMPGWGRWQLSHQ